MIEPESPDFENTSDLLSHGGLVEFDGQIVEVVTDNAENAARMADGGVNGITFLDQMLCPHVSELHQDRKVFIPYL